MKNGSNRFFENWKVVLLSLIGATTFWLFRALSKEHSALVSYPIEFEMNSDSVVVIDPLPPTVQIDVSSGGWNLFRRTLIFSVTPLKIELDNPADIRYLTRSTLLPVVRDQLIGLEINDLLTDTLHINVEKKTYKEVTIMVDSINLSIANRHRITSPISVTPQTVTLTGPTTIISSLQDVYYVMPTSRNIDEDLEEMVSIPLPFEDLMTATPGGVTVSFEVDRFDRKRIEVPLEIVNFPQDSIPRLQDSVIQVSYLIQRDLDEEFSPLDFGVMLDYLMLDSADSSITPILIYYPENVVEARLTQEEIQLLHR